MTMPVVALVADEESVRNPEMLGLAGENLAAQRWLALLTTAEDARLYLGRDSSIQEVWVAACGPIAPINLAATLKSDRANRRVCMLTAQDSGSLRSRSSAAGIDASLSPQAFVERYARCKQMAASGAFGVSAMPGSLYVQEKGKVGAAMAAPFPGREGQCTSGQVATTSRDAGFGGAVATNAAGGPCGMSGIAGAVPGAGTAPAPAAAPAALESPGVLGAAGSTAFGASGSSRSASSFAGAGSAGVLGSAGPADRRKTGLLLPVVSASGGCGKSAIALLSAYLLQAAGINTLLLDFDLQFGDMAELAGVERPLRIDELLVQPSRLDALKSEGSIPALLAAPAHVDSAEAVAEQAGELIEALRGRFDVVIANTGAAWAEQHAVLLECSSKVLFLIDQRQTSIRATRRALDLCTRCGIAVNPFVFALNGCGKGAPLASIDVSCALKGAEIRELRDGGPDVEDLLAAAAPLELIDSRNELASSLIEVLADMLPDEMAQRLRDGGQQPGASGSLFRGKKPRRRKRG